VEGGHPDLVGNLVPGWNVVSNNSNTSPVMFHGTSVAGVVAATSNNSTGVASVAWDAKIMPIRITNESNGWASTSNMADGILWAADHGARVANISYNISANSSLRNDAAQYMRSKGGLVVGAAGNDNTDAGQSDNPYFIIVGQISRIMVIRLTSQRRARTFIRPIRGVVILTHGARPLRVRQRQVWLR